MSESLKLKFALIYVPKIVPIRDLDNRTVTPLWPFPDHPGRALQVLAMVSDCAEPTGYLRGLETKNGHEHHNHNHHEHQEDVPSETYKELIEKLEPLSKARICPYFLF